MLGPGPRGRGCRSAAKCPSQCPAEAPVSQPPHPPPRAERSGLEKQAPGLAFEYPRDPEHRSYSDRGEPGAEDRARGDGHTGRQGLAGTGILVGAGRKQRVAILGISSFFPRRLRGAADGAKFASRGPGPSVAAAL